jgi:protein-tyrosine phosphatase
VAQTAAVTDPAPGAAIPMRAVANLRDLGRWRSRAGGTVRPGVVYRSAGLATATDEDLAALAGLGIRTVYDLRTAGERAAQPDRIPGSAAGVVVDVLGDSIASVPAHLMQLVVDPPRATAELAGGRAQALFAQAYRDIVLLPSAHVALRSLYQGLLDESRRPVLIHCTTGKDRTGWAAAALLMLLGVPDEDVMAEYLLTNAQLLPAVQPLFDAFAAGGGDPDVLLPVLGVRPEYLESARAHMTRGFGSVEGYFQEALGFDPSAQAALRDCLLLR